jgi:hypothetical protein
MAYRSRVYYTGTGSSQNLSVTFPYLDISHVHVFYDGVMQEDDSWSWLNSSTITLTAPSGTEVEIRRITPYDPMVTFTNASLLNEDDQNMAALQAIYLIEEGVSFSTVGFETTRSYAITFVLEGGAVALAPGSQGMLVVPMACIINCVYLISEDSGDIVIDIWKSSYADHPPTDADSITAAAPVTLEGSNKSLDATLTGWTKEIARNDILAFHVDSCEGIQQCTIAIMVTVVS